MADLEHERLHNIEIIQIIQSTFYWGTIACTILVPGGLNPPFSGTRRHHIHSKLT